MQYGNKILFEREYILRGLNRTMQYGNERTTQIARQEIIGLNRTMQYGNRKDISERAQRDLGLNRTMQYGNTLIAGAGESFMVV